jgi:hypothetical protein
MGTPMGPIWSTLLEDISVKSQVGIMRSPLKVALLSQALHLSAGLSALVVGIAVTSVPAQAAEKLPEAPTGEPAVSGTQVSQLVESFRRIAQQSTTHKSSTLYSEWRVSKQNIAPWSQQCLTTAMTPEEFDRDASTASKVVTCVVTRVLNNEFKATDRDEILAVRRTAAWWMTGDASRYNSPGTAAYTQRVLDAYQSGGTIAVVPTAKPVDKPVDKLVDKTTAKPIAKPIAADKKDSDKKDAPKPTGPSIDKVKPVAAGRSTPYDRYMKAGYDGEKAQNYKTALTFFRRALDERPNDTYATTAIQNTEAKQISGQAKPPSPVPKGNTVVVPTEAK